ncbi:MAG: patatin-like phospholipase family protein [Candidatus Melainabacteria bacterium]|nr:patatin-like phospholipase family protein [Candidatus Melainabacteria bacterium]MBI3309132.1 patatin-like phospholipase family protein [Candidatus Melainabacteria bacterium]
MKKVALVLSGGSARGAYEIGVLKALLPEVKKRGGFQIICGTSVGSLNACFLASLIHKPADEIIEGLEHYWLTLKREHVFQENWAHAGLRSFLGSMKLGQPEYPGLLDNASLKTILENDVNWEQLRKNIDDGLIYALTITATSVSSGRSVVFYESADSHCIKVIPADSHTRFVPDKINHTHALASSAIPIFFKPEKIVFQDHSKEHVDWFIDGGVRQNTPLLPALTLGADALAIVGLYHDDSSMLDAEDKPSLLQNIGKLLNALFLDHIRYDTQTLRMVNEILEAINDETLLDSINEKRERRGKKKWRIIPDFIVSPSRFMSDIAEEIWDNYPETRKNFRTLDWLFKLGNLKRHLRGDLLSYFFFHPIYAKALIDLGYKDATEAIKQTVWDPIKKVNVNVLDRLFNGY